MGDKSNIDKQSPVLLQLQNVIQIEASSFHSLALTSTGSLFSWGYNFVYVLGDGTTEDRNEPIEVEFFKKNSLAIESVSSKRFFCIA